MMYTNAILSAAHKELCCSICVDMLTDPVMMPTCGHCFCLKCAQRSLEQSSSCPLCKAKVGSSTRALLSLPLLAQVVLLSARVAQSHGVEDLAFASQWSQPTPAAGTSPALLPVTNPVGPPPPSSSSPRRLQRGARWPIDEELPSSTSKTVSAHPPTEYHDTTQQPADATPLQEVSSGHQVGRSASEAATQHRDATQLVSVFQEDAETLSPWRVDGVPPLHSSSRSLLACVAQTDNASCEPTTTRSPKKRQRSKSISFHDDDDRRPLRVHSLLTDEGNRGVVRSHSVSTQVVTPPPPRWASRAAQTRRDRETLSGGRPLVVSSSSDDSSLSSLSGDSSSSNSSASPTPLSVTTERVQSAAERSHATAIVEEHHCVLCRLSVTDRRAVGALLAKIVSCDPSCDVAMLRGLDETALQQLLGSMCGPFIPHGGGKSAEALCYAHYMCLLWSPEVSVGAVKGSLDNVPSALRRGLKLKCSFCRLPGATLGCADPACRKSFHIPCAMLCGSGVCSVDHMTFTLRCDRHAALPPPPLDSPNCPAWRKRPPVN